MNETKNFYNSLSCEYDKMTGFTELLEKRETLLKNIISDKIKTAADIGCGTGLDSIALSLNGIKVYGFDPSEKMTKKAEENSKIYNQNIMFETYSADEIPERFNNYFDMAISGGNTFANIEPHFLLPSLKRIYEILRPDGIFVLQMLNYIPILKKKERIVNIRNSDGTIYIRFYDFTENSLVFNLLIFKTDDTSKYELISTPLFPYTRDEIETAFKKSGFRHISVYSDMQKARFEPEISKDIIYIAEK